MTRRTLLTVAVLAGLALTAGAGLGQEHKSMKFARYVGAGGTPVFGVVEGDQLREIRGDLFGKWQPTDRVTSVGQARFLPVTDARTVYGLAGNYQDHIAKLTSEQKEKFKIPQFFLKTPGCLNRHGGDVVYPPDAGRLDPEGELVIVIGKAGKHVPKDRVKDYVFGVTCGNDVGARDWQKNDVQWWRAKGSDTFGPCGPFIVTGLDYDNLPLVCRVNGKVRTQTNTKHMVHDVAAIVSFLSDHITLRPGDLIFTGTAGQTEPIQVGDVVEVELAGVGVLRNRVVAGK